MDQLNDYRRLMCLPERVQMRLAVGRLWGVARRQPRGRGQHDAMRTTKRNGPKLAPGFRRSWRTASPAAQWTRPCGRKPRLHMCHLPASAQHRTEHRHCEWQSQQRPHTWGARSSRTPKCWRCRANAPTRPPRAGAWRSLTPARRSAAGGVCGPSLSLAPPSCDGCPTCTT